MARNAHFNGTDVAGGTPRASLLRRVLWHRAVPGSMAVIAALTIPEFSVGADDLDSDKRRPKPPQPQVKDGVQLGKQAPSTAKTPLAGVRYGGLLAIREASLTPSASTLGDTIIASPSLPSQPVAPLAIVPARAKTAGAQSRSAPLNTLDDAAAFAATLLDTMAVQPGLQDAALPDTPQPKLAKLEAIDMAASYAAMTLDRFVEGAAARVEQVAEWEPQDELLLDLDSAITPEAALARPPLREGIIGAVGPAVPLELEEAEPALAAVRDAAAFSTPAVGAAPVPAPVPAVVAAAAQPIAAPVQPGARSASAPTLETAAVAALPKPRPAVPETFGTSTPAAGEISAPLAFDLKSQLVTRIDGKTAGKVDFRQTATGLSVRLGSIVSVLGDRYDSAEAARITASAASNAYISLAELQAQGIPISYDPVYDEFNIGNTDTRPKAARKVHIDQISTPERGAGTAAMDQVRR